jgi:membrane protein required for colicin V production
MTWIDVGIVVIFIFFIVTAFQAGLVREVIGLGSAVLGVVLAGMLYDDIADSLLTSIDDTTTAAVVAFLIIFLGITLIGQLTAMVVHPVVTVFQLGLFDQILGGAFGAVKAFVIIEALLILFVTFPRYDLKDRIQGSEIAPKMLDASRPVLTILPSVFDQNVHPNEDLDCPTCTPQLQSDDDVPDRDLLRAP